MKKFAVNEDERKLKVFGCSKALFYSIKLLIFKIRNTTGFLNPEHYRIPKSGILPDPYIRETTGSTNLGNYRIPKSGTHE